MVVRAYVALNSEVTKLIFATSLYTSLPPLFSESDLSKGQQEKEDNTARALKLLLSLLNLRCFILYNLCMTKYKVNC